MSGHLGTGGTINEYDLSASFGRRGGGMGNYGGWEMPHVFSEVSDIGRTSAATKAYVKGLHNEISELSADERSRDMHRSLERETDDIHRDIKHETDELERYMKTMFGMFNNCMPGRYGSYGSCGPGYGGFGLMEMLVLLLFTGRRGCGGLFGGGGDDCGPGNYGYNNAKLEAMELVKQHGSVEKAIVEKFGCVDKAVALAQGCIKEAIIADGCNTRERLDTKIEWLCSKLDCKLDRFSDRSEMRFDRVYDKQDNLKDRFTEYGFRNQQHLSDIETRVNEKFCKLSHQVERGFCEQSRETEKGFDRIERKLEQDRVKFLENELAEERAKNHRQDTNCHFNRVYDEIRELATCLKHIVHRGDYVFAKPVCETTHSHHC